MALERDDLVLLPSLILLFFFFLLGEEEAGIKFIAKQNCSAQPSLFELSQMRGVDLCPRFSAPFRCQSHHIKVFIFSSQKCSCFPLGHQWPYNLLWDFLGCYALLFPSNDFRNDFASTRQFMPSFSYFIFMPSCL